MPNDLTFFLREPVEEKLLLSVLESVTGTPCGSLELPNESASVFLMSLESSQGFRQGVSLMWPLTILWPFILVPTKVELCDRIASALQAEVLFEADDSISDTNLEKWLLATPGEGSPHAVNIKELTDGIYLASDA